MKRKILTLLLILCLLPLASLLSACGNSGGYNLKNLSKDFYAVAETENDNIVKQNNKIVFDYSNQVFNSKQFLNNAINNTSVYSNLKSYNTVYENLMSFSFSYIEACSNENLDVDKETKNSLETSLNELKLAIQDVNSCTDMFAEPLKITSEEDIATNDICLDSFKNLLTSYEALFEKCTNFSTKLENIYFNYVLTNSNPNVTNTSLEDFDANIVVNNLDARIKWQKSNLTKTYVEMYICGGNLAEAIRNGGNLNLNNYNYLTNVNAINYEVSSQTAAEIANNSANKENFYNLSVKAFNAQTIINNDTSKFSTARNKIVYTEVANNLTAATSTDLICKEIIEDFNALLGEYNSVLASLINIINI